MTRARDVRWGRWVGAVAGGLVVLKSAAFVSARAFALAKSEAQARGSDVAFVLGLAERRKRGHG